MPSTSKVMEVKRFFSLSPVLQESCQFFVDSMIPNARQWAVKTSAKCAAAVLTSLVLMLNTPNPINAKKKGVGGVGQQDERGQDGGGALGGHLIGSLAVVGDHCVHRHQLAFSP